MTWREVQTQFRHPLFVGMILMLELCIVLIGPYDHLLNFDALQLAIFYAVAFTSFTAALYGAFYICHQCGWRAYSLFTVTFGCVAATVCGLSVALVLGAPMPGFRDMALVTGFNLVFCYLGEVIQSTFIIPRVLADLRGRPQKAVLAEFITAEAGALPHQPVRFGPGTIPPPIFAGRPAEMLPLKAASVTLFGQVFRTSSISLIAAEEHYVAVILQDGTRHLLRGRIADAVASLPPDLGQRVHRSYWVATAAVAGFRPDKPGAQLVLTTGQTLPVARPRLAAIRDWAEAAAERSKAGQGTARPVKPEGRKAKTRKAPQRVPHVSS
ncbi:LytTR family DNA-binding domain-containing protein [Pseudotabrizicola sp. 4114]|uniref:LytTR family DNA-binding domain-containing protein n=1 Tax=Pseudotabrizicola sp. 4114 TaxID=2817731 RepID=UPI0028660F11|nr:hypothetical protein [Pseudorhodobacter sp. 4114]